MARGRSRVKGAAKVKRLLKRLPADIGNEILAIYRQDGPVALAYSRGSTPRRTGALANALSMKIYPKSLKMRIGLIGKAVNQRLFYGNILEKGRRAQIVTARRAGGRPYSLKVSGINRSTFDIVRGRVSRFTFDLIRPKLVLAYQRALRKAQAGAGSDAD